MMPAVSVIMATYNRARLMERALQSALNQTYRDFEIIVVDDGSTDNTAEIIGKYVEKDSRVRYIKHDANKGAAASWNTGIAASGGKYIAFIDSDDVWYEDKLEKQVKIFEAASPDVGVVCSGFVKMEKHRKKYCPMIPEVRQKDMDARKCLLKRNFALTSTTMIRRDCLESAGLFDERMPRFQQWDLMIRISKSYRFVFIDEPLVENYPQRDSLSADPSKTLQGWEIIFEKYFDEFTCDKKLLAYRYNHIGSLLMLAGDPVHGRKYLLRAAAAYPQSVKTWLRLFVSLFGSGIFGKIKNFYGIVREFALRIGKENLQCQRSA